jgi:hypothetical protein
VLTEAVDDGDGYGAFLATIKHGHHPAEEQGNRSPDAGAPKADEDVAASGQQGRQRLWGCLDLPDGGVRHGDTKNEGYSPPDASGEEVIRFLAGPVCIPTHTQRDYKGDTVYRDRHDWEAGQRLIYV